MGSGRHARMRHLGATSCSQRLPSANAALDQRVEQPAEQPVHRMRVVHVDQVEAEQDEDHIDDQDHVQDVRHGGTLKLEERRGAILSRSPGTKKARSETGLLQLDARQTSRRPACGERGAVRLPCRPPVSHNVQCRIRFQGSDNKKQPEGLSLRLSARNRQFREATAVPHGSQNSA